MFDRLIETEPEGANFQNRRRYFMTSSIIVGILFLTAVVISIYASDYGLGSENFDLAIVTAPPDIEPATQPPNQQHTSSVPQSQDTSPVKPIFVAPVTNPLAVPQKITTVPGNVTTWKQPLATGSDDPIGGGRNVRPGDAPGTLNAYTKPEPVAEPDPEPPPVVHKPVEEKPAIIKSPGALNGKATYLPKPPYPAAAVAANIQGKVDVQVTVDEAGNVTSASAATGNAFLKTAAVKAAWQAKFSPTYLGKTPVKVTGIITYDFKR